MDIILLQRIKNLGKLGDKVSVKAGYGRNFLIPQGKAVAATEANTAAFEARRAELEKAEAEIDWQTLAAYQRQKKFGDTLPIDWPERARQSRFLAGRGFYLETINAVFHEKC